MACQNTRVAVADQGEGPGGPVPPPPPPYLKVWIRHLVVSGEVLLANFISYVKEIGQRQVLVRVYVAVECDITLFSGQ